jgi:hypothetical protein
MSGVLSVSLSSTPPLATPSPVVRGGSGKRGAAGNVVSFRSGLPEDGPLAGSLKSGGLSRSLTEGLGAASLGRSLSRSRTASGEGLQSSSAAPASAARPLQSTKSIPKSAAFVKIEGFDTAGFDAASPAASPPPSPQQPRTLSSLLSRQLSTDRLPGLAGSPSLASPLASPGLPEEPLGGLVSRLEAAVRVAPVPRPPQLHPARRGTVPDNLLKQLQEQHSVFSEPVCVRAFSIARFAHDGKYRASGEPAFMHCVEVARILAELGAGEATVAAALLHDVLDKTLLVEGQLRPMLQDDGVADLVKQVAHLGDVSSKYRACPATSPEGQTATASALVGMLVAMGANGALLVKLADRLHDMRTLGALPAAKRNRLARETIDVWAPLANRLGVWSLKAQLEDLAFKQLFPAQFAELRDRLAQVQSAGVLVSLCDKLRAEMQRQDISYHDLSGRPKHLWGVFKKMTSKNYSLSRISDVRGLRIIVESKADCYRALRAVEAVWKSVGPTKDYIRRPKENGYRSLHTVVRGEDGHDIEVQIRTAKMHFFAEYGSEAAHWQYKERGYGSGAAGSSPAATAGAVGPAATISSLDEDQPTAAGARSAGAGDAAREANWAKFVLSQQVGFIVEECSLCQQALRSCRAAARRSPPAGCCCAEAARLLPRHLTVTSPHPLFFLSTHLPCRCRTRSSALLARPPRTTRWPTLWVLPPPPPAPLAAAARTSRRAAARRRMSALQRTLSAAGRSWSRRLQSAWWSRWCTTAGFTSRRCLRAPLWRACCPSEA